MPQIIDINATVERIGVGKLAIFVIALCFLMMMSDGYDFVALSVAVPAILRDFAAVASQVPRCGDALAAWSRPMSAAIFFRRICRCSNS